MRNGGEAVGCDVQLSKCTILRPHLMFHPNKESESSYRRLF